MKAAESTLNLARNQIRLWRARWTNTTTCNTNGYKFLPGPSELLSLASQWSRVYGMYHVHLPRRHWSFNVETLNWGLSLNYCCPLSRVSASYSHNTRKIFHLRVFPGRVTASTKALMAFSDLFSSPFIHPQLQHIVAKMTLLDALLFYVSAIWSLTDHSLSDHITGFRFRY